MPVDFLTPEQRARYGRYGEDPSPEQLARCFHLTIDDRELIDKGRSDRARLGLALQLGTVCFLGTFLANPTDVPTVVVDHLAELLGIADSSVLKGYGETAMRFKHTAAIKERYGYTDFADQPGHLRFVRWLYTRAYIAGERHVVLFDLCTVRMVEAKVLLPAATTLERLVATVKERAATQLWRALGSLPDQAATRRLEDLVVVPKGRRRSALDRLRAAPTDPTIDGIVGALRRLEEIQKLGAQTFDLGRLPPGRTTAMARWVAKAKAAEIERMPAERRLAHLVAYSTTLAASATDDVLTILDEVVGGLLSRVKRRGEQRRLRTLGDLDRAALTLQEAWVDLKAAAEDPEADVRATIMRLAGERVDAAASIVTALARPPDDRYFEDLPSRYHVRRFLPALLRLVPFEGTEAARPVLAAWEFLARQEGPRPRPRWSEAPLEVATGCGAPLWCPSRARSITGRTPCAPWSGCGTPCGAGTCSCPPVDRRPGPGVPQPGAQPRAGSGPRPADRGAGLGLATDGRGAAGKRRPGHRAAQRPGLREAHPAQGVA